MNWLYDHDYYQALDKKQLPTSILTYLEHLDLTGKLLLSKRKQLKFPVINKEDMQSGKYDSIGRVLKEMKGVTQPTNKTKHCGIYSQHLCTSIQLVFSYHVRNMFILMLQYVPKGRI